MSRCYRISGINVELMTAWHPFPWDLWEDYIRSQLDQDVRLAVETHLPWPAHTMSVEVSTAGWLSIRCDTCQVSVWERSDVSG